MSKLIQNKKIDSIQICLGGIFICIILFVHQVYQQPLEGDFSKVDIFLQYISTAAFCEFIILIISKNIFATIVVELLIICWRWNFILIFYNYFLKKK
jgi:hypothetical protein